MTLSGLSKILDQYDKRLGSYDLGQLELLRALPFYSDWDQLETNCSDSDFNHAIGLPEKNGRPTPLFDYEQQLYDKLQHHKHLWIKKATGLGITELMLIYDMALLTR